MTDIEEKPRRSARSRLEESLPYDDLPESVECPHCQGQETEVFAAFGSALSVSQYYCRPCRTVFEYMKWMRRADSGS